MPDATNSMIVMQQITTIWSKSARGAQGREVRARLPQWYPLPDAALVSRASRVGHLVQRREPDYATTECVETTSGDSTGPQHRSVAAVTDGDGIAVVFEWPGDCGVPARHQRRIVLRSGSWARVYYNGRFIGHEHSWYEDKIVNVAFGILPIRDLFQAPPTAELECRVDLW